MFNRCQVDSKPSCSFLTIELCSWFHIFPNEGQDDNKFCRFHNTYAQICYKHKFHFFFQLEWNEILLLGWIWKNAHSETPEPMLSYNENSILIFISLLSKMKRNDICPADLKLHIVPLEMPHKYQNPSPSTKMNCIHNRCGCPVRTHQNVC